ncbi:hypothetical protein TWF281_000177 [Arthrobotrys megalospora]
MELRDKYKYQQQQMMNAPIELPRTLRDIRIDLMRLKLPTSTSDSIAKLDPEVLKAKYFTEGRYYPNYATATGHSEFLRERNPSDPFFVWFHIKNLSNTTWELITAEDSEWCQFTYPPPEKIMPGADKSIVLERLGTDNPRNGIDVKVGYKLENDDTEIVISIKKERVSAETDVSCTGLETEKYAVETLFDGAIFVVLNE